MTDFHSHILPNMDDGSKSPGMSCEMLRASRSQGVDSVVLTPHFYPQREEPESFLARRKKCALSLLDAVKESNDGIPNLFLGCEIAFYEGISRSREVNKLCISGTDWLMIEMPFSKWTNRTVKELLDLRDEAGVQIMLAHINRYFDFADSKMISSLARNGIAFQVNAEAFERFSTRRAVIKMMKRDEISFLGSDSHDTEKRKPNMSTAITEIEKRLGEDMLFMLESCGRWITQKALPLEKAVLTD